MFLSIQFHWNSILLAQQIRFNHFHSLVFRSKKSFLFVCCLLIIKIERCNRINFSSVQIFLEIAQFCVYFFCFFLSSKDLILVGKSLKCFIISFGISIIMSKSVSKEIRSKIAFQPSSLCSTIRLRSATDISLDKYLNVKLMENFST